MAAATTIHPTPAAAGRCPRCQAPLQVERLRFPGWRSLVEGACPECGHRYLQDLPAGHGLLYPTTLDLDTGELLDPVGAEWFSRRLKEIWEQPDSGDVRFEVERRREVRRAVLVNCVDVVYGHALLKLLAAQREAEDSERGCVVMIPASLAMLVPDRVAEVWAIHEPVSRLGGWLAQVDQAVDRELARFDECALAPAYPHPHPSTYDLERLLGQVAPERLGSPSIVLSFREDRPWGGSPAEQSRRVAELWRGIEAELPDARAAAIGLEPRELPLPEAVEDLRAERPSPADEERWIGLMRGADLAIGALGSNMLLPSGLARATVELVPESRYDNVFQDTLTSGTDPLMALARHRSLYGDETLSEIAPERVAAVALSTLRTAERFPLVMTGPAAGVGEGPIPQLPRSIEAPPEEPGLIARVRAAGPGGMARAAGARLRDRVRDRRLARQLRQ